MSRKDARGRKLKDGEDQMASGRYRYRYTDIFGNRKTIYSWRLVTTDKTPKGKKYDRCLREKIEEIEKEQKGSIYSYEGHELTVTAMIKKYLATKPNLANSTKTNYMYLIEKNVEPNDFGKMKIATVKKSDVKEFYAYLFEEKGFAVGTIQLYQNIIFPAFQMAVDDDIIRKNPCKDCMKGYSHKNNTSNKKPLTRQEQVALLKFVSEDPVYSRYYVLIAFMLSTGCRIGETVGITWDNIDFKERTLLVDHQIIYKKKGGKTRHYAAPPKNGTSRVIPLKEDILKILKQYKKDNSWQKEFDCCEVDGYKNFVFLNTRFHLHIPNTIVRVLDSIRARYNSVCDPEKGDVLLPKITPHTFRHTFCTRMAENGMDVKVLQEIMGHKTIAITMQVYNHVLEERKKAEVNRVDSALNVN